VQQSSRQLWVREASGTNSKESQSSRIKNPVLKSLADSIPRESFRPLLDKGYVHERKSNAGRKRIDPLILFKMLVLQKLFNLRHEELEFQVNDRRSFDEFVGIGVMNSIPDATTVAFFRERLRKAGVIEELFKMFEAYRRSQRLQARGGKIIDATLVPVPKQRNTREENKEIKAGRLPEGWDENTDRLQQKDLDARRTKRTASVTTVTRTVSASMSTMDSSADMLSLLHISTTARCFHTCWIQKTNMTMSGQTQRSIPVKASRIF
jgi:IS5 family transposase